MIREIYLGLILIFFILAFFVRNIKTTLSTKQSIRGKSVRLSISVLISGIIYSLILLRLTILGPGWMFELEAGYVWMDRLGLIFVTVGFILGILAMIGLNKSWRVGIKYDQKTKLITTGLYSISRNPYFLSYSILIFGYLMIFPSPILLALLVALAITFHKMILEEEVYLEAVHGKAYLKFKQKVNRYLTFISKKN